MSMEIWQAIAAIVILAGIPIGIVWSNRPTENDKAIYALGYQDGADGRVPEQFGHPRNNEVYREAYAEGSRGRTRREDAERLARRGRES